MNEAKNFNSPPVEVRGHSHFNREASRNLRFLAGFFDILVGVLLLEAGYWITHAPLILNWKVGPLLALNILMPWISARSVANITIGELIWQIRQGMTRVRSLADELRGSFLTLMILLACLGILKTQILSHPFWETSETIIIPAQLPPSNWKYLAFYYSLAPWPIAVDEQPVFFSIPYELAPPRRFIGHIRSEWLGSAARLTLEGPKTPQEFQARIHTRNEIRNCFRTSPLLSPSCVEVRKLTLERPVKELRELGYAQLSVNWFVSENPAIPEEKQTQGVRIRATDGDQIEDRYILITPQGMHQSIALSYFDSAEGHQAENNLRITLGALQISEDLNQGRAWMDQVLQSTRLDQLNTSTGSSADLRKLAQIQSLLISKLSMEPASFEAYYHLSGAEFLLLKLALRTSNAPLKSYAQTMIETLNRYAHDVAPQSPKIRELDRILTDSKHF